MDCGLYWDEFEDTRKPNEHVHICMLDDEHREAGKDKSHRCLCGRRWETQ